MSATVTTVRSSRSHWVVRPAGYWTDIHVLKGVGQKQLTEEEAVAMAFRIRAAREGSR